MQVVIAAKLVKLEAIVEELVIIVQEHLDFVDLELEVSFLKGDSRKDLLEVELLLAYALNQVVH